MVGRFPPPGLFERRGKVGEALLKPRLRGGEFPRGGDFPTARGGGGEGDDGGGTGIPAGPRQAMTLAEAGTTSWTS